MFKKIMLPCRINKKNFLFSTMIFLILASLLIVETNMLSDVSSQFSIADGYGYSTTKLDTDADMYEIIPFDYTGLVTYGPMLNNISVDIRDLEYLDSPEELYSNNLSKISDGTFVEEYNIILSPYGSLIKNFKTGIEDFGTGIVYAGAYPANSQEISVPLNIALDVAASNGLSSYSDVVGMNYSFELNEIETPVTISGVTDSDNVILGSDGITKVPSDITPAYIYEGDMGSLESYCDKADCDIQTNLDFSNSQLIFFIFFQYVIIIAIYLTLLFSNVKASIAFLNSINYTCINYIYSVLSYGLVILIILLLIFNTLK